MVPSFWHLIIVAVVVMVLFGKGRISDLMEDVGKGVKSFKKGIADDEVPVMKPITHVEPQAIPPVQTPTATPPSETH